MHESAENYLETILMLSNRMENVRSIDIVHELGFSKPSVSVAMKRLRTGGYIDVDGKGHITLTDSGRQIAESIFERHEVLTKIFTDIGVSEETAAEDACKIEHYISQETFEKIKEYVKKSD